MADLAVDHVPRFQRDLSVVNTFKISFELRAVPPELIKLAVEIVSPSSRRRDWVEKRRAYAKLGIPNYMLVELTEAGAPRVYYQRLVDGVYHLAAKASAGQTIRIDDPIVVEFDPATLVDIDVC